MASLLPGWMMRDANKICTAHLFRVSPDAEWKQVAQNLSTENMPSTWMFPSVTSATCATKIKLHIVLSDNPGSWLARAVASCVGQSDGHMNNRFRELQLSSAHSTCFGKVCQHYSCRLTLTDTRVLSIEMRTQRRKKSQRHLTIHWSRMPLLVSCQLRWKNNHPFLRSTFYNTSLQKRPVLNKYVFIQFSVSALLPSFHYRRVVEKNCRGCRLQNTRWKFALMSLVPRFYASRVNVTTNRVQPWQCSAR